ncbi:MAG: glycosyltransferase [Chitinophagaceae bacterium]|nr:glycosyltransferase [Chitinophagaceae bacterium]
MKVLHVISGLRSGGAEHFVLGLCRQSKKDPGTEMSVLTLGTVDDISHKFREAGIEVITAPGNKPNNRSFKAFSAFRILLRQPHKIIHAHMFHACVIACCVKLFRPSIKIVFTLHNDHVSHFHRRIFLFFTRSLRKTDVVFPGMKRKWFQKSKPAIVANGIDVAQFSFSDEKPPGFLCAFVGRLNHEKNPLFLVELAKAFRGKPLRISVAGDGPLRTALEQKILSENLSRHFNVMGNLDDVTILLSRCHCLLIPSLWEGMPLVLLEAAASGVPVIATPVGVIPSLVSDDEGYVGELHTFPGMLTKVIENYDEALAKAQRLKQKIIASYSIERSYSLYKSIYSH